MRKTRSGYSLMEMVVVCAVLVVAGAIAVPVVQTMFTGSRLDAARDAVRTSLSRARQLAVKESQPYRFDIRNNTGFYRIAPEGQAEGAGMELSLPDEVFFCCDDDQLGGNDWSTLTVFLPDGSAENNATVSIRTANTAPVTLQLRATTGSVVTAAVRLPGAAF